MGRISEYEEHYGGAGFKCSCCGDVAKAGGCWIGVTDIVFSSTCLYSKVLAALLADGIMDTNLGINRLNGLTQGLLKFEKEFWRAACLAALRGQKVAPIDVLFEETNPNAP